MLLSVKVTVSLIIGVMLIFNKLFVFFEVAISIFGVDLFIVFFGFLEKFFLNGYFIPVDRFKILQVDFISFS